MLQDTDPVPPPDLGPTVEEQPIPRRVCDEAYLLLQPWVYPDRSEEERFFHETEFVHSSDEERDAAIRKTQETSVWKHLLEPI